MRALLQRVTSASLTVDGSPSGQMDHGLVVFIGIEAADSAQDAAWLVRKILSLRLFGPEDRPPDQNVLEAGGSCMVISQFTLHASTRKGTRPSYHRAAPPDHARPLFETTVQIFRNTPGLPCHAGQFGSHMEVTLTNDGPVTLWIDTRLRE